MAGQFLPDFIKDGENWHRRTVALLSHITLGALMLVCTFTNNCSWPLQTICMSVMFRSCFLVVFHPQRRCWARALVVQVILITSWFKKHTTEGHNLICMMFWCSVLCCDSMDLEIWSRRLLPWLSAWRNPEAPVTFCCQKNGILPAHWLWCATGGRLHFGHPLHVNVCTSTCSEPKTKKKHAGSVINCKTQRYCMHSPWIRQR